jgi:predicted transcriptional regulator
MSKRMPVEIIAEILEQCLAENSKTRIMYRSNLSFEGVTKYLAWLTSIGLLEKDPSTRKYQTTPKGEELLSCWSETCKLLEIEKQNRRTELIPETGYRFPYSQVR